MTGYSATLIVGLGLIVIGLVLLFFLPQRPGGSVNAFTVEVSALGAGLVLIVVGLAAMAWAAPQIPQLGPVLGPGTPTPIAARATAGVPTSFATPPVTGLPAAPTATTPAPSSANVTCEPKPETGTLPLKDGPSTTFLETPIEGRSIEVGETVQVLGWSYPTDGSAMALFWFYVRTSKGEEGWMQSRENATPAGSGYVYPTCSGIDPRVQDPSGYKTIPRRSP